MGYDLDSMYTRLDLSEKIYYYVQIIYMLKSIQKMHVYYKSGVVSTYHINKIMIFK